MLDRLKNIGVVERYLPEECYSGRPLPVIHGMVTHGFSAKNIDHGFRFDEDLCWELMRDLNYPKDERKYTYQRDKDPDDRAYASAHFMFHRNGDCEITVPLDKQAYHAGASEWKGLVGLNQYFLGSEFIGAEGEDYTDDQYIMGGMVYAIVMNYHGLTMDDIPGHYQVSPGRKTDPWPKTDTKGGWDWDRFHNEIEQHLMDEYESAS